jgi:predicted acyl esterase
MKRIIYTLILLVSTATFSNAQLTPTYDDIFIPMSDGDSLSADVYIPTGPGPFEVILIQTPYDKDDFEAWLPMGVGQNLNGQPFAWVIVDWRGFYGSSGAAAGPTNGEDGYDVCEWISQQAWHGSRIGTWGPSALGKVQYNTAQEQHPNHTCAVPLVAEPHQAYDSYFYGGVLEEARLNTLDALGYGLSAFIFMNDNIYHNPTWQWFENNTWNPSGITIPTLQIGGWYDHAIDKMLDWYTATRTGADPTVQDEQWLLVGPWVHGGTGAAYVGSSVQGELNYPNAEYVSDSMAWDFLNYYLLDAPNSWDTTSMITYYELGNDTWHVSNATSLFVGTANELFLDQNEMLRNQYGFGSTTFVCDPNDPSPTIGGATLHPLLDQGPYDQAQLNSRSDVLSFATDALTTDVTLQGRVRATIYVSSDQPDGDIAIRLMDVYPDQREMLITDGIKRIRFRNGYTMNDEVFMTPGLIYEIEVDLPFTHYTWNAGHQIKIMVSGNHSIRWNVNLQDGGPMYVAGTGNVANMTIHHDNLNPSRIELPGVNPVLGVKATKFHELEIYPNPAVDEIKINSNIQFSEYRIVDIFGRTVISGSINSNKIELIDIEAGNYILELENGGNHYRSKFVKR